MNRLALVTATALTMVSASAAMAVTPLTTTVSTTAVAANSAALTASTTGVSTTKTVNGTVAASNVTVGQFNTATGILVGATVNVNTAVNSTVVVTGTVPANGNGRRVDASTSLTGTVSTAGVTFGSTPTPLAVTHFCSGNNCTASASNQTRSVAGTIVGTSAVPLANLSAYAGTGTVAFTRSATGSSTATTSTNASVGTADGLFTFGGATTASNVYSISYDYVNFANPSFNGLTTQTALTLDFGSLHLNSGPVTLNFKLFNIGNINSAGLSLTAIGRSTNNLNFTTTATTFTNGLDGGNSLNYSMTFNPSVIGAANDIFTFILKDYAAGGAGVGAKQYSLAATVIANVTGIAPAPEPATWSMFVIGFGVIGASLRRRRDTMANTAA
jgi:hypothetical protein